MLASLNSGILSAVSRASIKSLRVGGGLLCAELEVTRSERDLLHTLFVGLGDLRALLAREVDVQSVGLAVQSITADLTRALQELGPDCAVGSSLEMLRAACREYLDAMAHRPGSSFSPFQFTQAVMRLRAIFAMVAEFIGSEYRLQSATRLAAAIPVFDLRVF
jgi:hypothetical protein